ncbi:MAG TPA: HAD-IA family hydrolase [Baekduia sp.]|uniref:HAD-IA family hydrolase n=1 Tax=Baekduia sp. TaxID=2600305 RepID=UPI002C5D045E|nr:HAD-IA family hydrolase [Baekduia sp.]HMJ35850.1 HAD-IA family hydrolase [Baekduia sp.]
MITTFSAILSDLDGVLVDSGEAIEAAWGAWARGHDLDPGVLDGRIHGVRTLDVIRAVAPRLDVVAEAAAVEDLVLHGPAATVLAGAAELLGGAAGVPVAVVTSCPGVLAQRRLRDAELPAPAVLVTADRVGAGKPDPEGYRLAAAELGVAPERCVVFEDAPAGIAAGRAAGASVIAIATTHRREELSLADAIVGSVAEALELVASGVLQPQL